MTDDDEAWLHEIVRRVREADAPVPAQNVLPEGRQCTANVLRRLHELGVESTKVATAGKATVFYGQESELRERLAVADARLAELGAMERELEHAVKVQMDALHGYNEAKDATQVLLGKLAEWDGTTTREQHEHFGLPTDSQ